MHSQVDNMMQARSPVPSPNRLLSNTPAPPVPAAGPKQLYTVLEQQKAAVGAGTLMGSEHTYVIPGAGKEKLSIAAQVRMGGWEDSCSSRLCSAVAGGTVFDSPCHCMHWCLCPVSSCACSPALPGPTASRRSGWRRCARTCPQTWMCPSIRR